VSAIKPDATLNIGIVVGDCEVRVYTRTLTPFGNPGPWGLLTVEPDLDAVGEVVAEELADLHQRAQEEAAES
jgi:hypothetical protein